MVKKTSEVLKITTGKIHTNDLNNYKAMSEVISKEKGDIVLETEREKLDTLWSDNVDINF
jgi:hypothetical protein